MASWLVDSLIGWWHFLLPRGAWTVGIYGLAQWNSPQHSATNSLGAFPVPAGEHSCSSPWLPHCISVCLGNGCHPFRIWEIKAGDSQWLVGVHRADQVQNRDEVGVSSFMEHHGDFPWELPRSQRLVDIWASQAHHMRQN